uniref:Mitochondrial carrier protein n=1 Tax=Spongospora subterranea TaxID=70186 RepID=A0A0H5QZD8_9EUKA|eukprot:CRZ07327.1 hypothetical protein [Spongospora subterranea]
MEVTDRKQSLPILHSLIAGGSAGGVAKTTIAPLDRVKIIYQVSSSQQFTFSAAYRSIKQIIKDEGVMGLWKGNTATLLRIIPYAAIQYTTFEQSKKMWMYVRPLSKDSSGISGFGRFVCGGVAGFTSVAITYPLDLLRARLAVAGPGPRIGSLFRLSLGLYRDSGIRGFYKGLVPTLIGIIPYAGISFYTFETLKYSYLEKHDTDTLPQSARMLFGGCGGFLAQSASYPLEIIRRRMQVQGSVTTRSSRHVTYALASQAGMVPLVKHIYKHEGIVRGLYKGLSMNWVKGPIAVGISFTVYDAVTTLLRDTEYLN